MCHSHLLFKKDSDFSFRNEFHEFIKDENEKKYILNTVWVNKKSGGVYKSYIIH
jgi:hypothetical protein